MQKQTKHMLLLCIKQQEMRRKKMKKAVSIVFTILTILLTVSPCAFAIESGEQYTFVNADNSIIYYYLDENEMPYNYQNGEKIYLLIPIESCIITDEAKLQQLNADLSAIHAEQQSVTGRRSAPTSYYSLMQNSVSVNSNVYTQYMTLENGGNRTAYLKKYTAHSYMRIKTAELGKPNALSSKKVNLTITSYLEAYDQWVEVVVKGIDLTSSLGEGFNMTSGVNYFYAQIDKYANPVWFTLNIWTSPYAG